jgi:hypothetical protein
MENLNLLSLSYDELTSIDGGLDKNSTAYKIGHAIGSGINMGLQCIAIATIILMPKS